LSLSSKEKRDILFIFSVLTVALVLAFIVNYLNISLPSTGFVKSLAGFITSLIESTGYIGILILMILESALIPIPSEIIMPFAGYIVYRGELDLILVVLMGTLGNLIGSLLAYYVGLYGGRPFIEKYGKYILIRHSHLETAERLFNHYGDIIIFASRMLPAVRTVISLPAGIGRMDIKRFSIYTIIGSIPWNFALTYLGFLLGSKWDKITFFFEKADIIFVIALIIILVYYILSEK